MKSHKYLSISFFVFYPIIAISLILLALIVATAPPLGTYELPYVTLPRVSTSEMQTEDHLAVTITAEEEFYLNGKRISREDLRKELRKKMITDPYYLVIIRADTHIPYLKFLSVLKDIKETGAKRVAVACKKKRSRY